ncbi:hypothetical protein EC991_004477 [Linnemannia zychae]|nr:hypothetical protein EC991_004477 [Linnemannia zychae]
MSPTNRNYCCCCIPYRVAVLIVSLFALAFGGVNLWNILRSGITDATTRYSMYALACVYLLLGVSGLCAVLIKKYAIAKNFSVLWWTATVLITILSVAGIVLLATREQEEVKGLCQAAILEDNPKYQGNPYNTTELAEDVASCYRTTMIVIGVVTSVQLFLMMVGGSVASSYTSEVKHRKNGLTYTYGQGYAFLQPQPQPPMQQTQPQQYQKTHPYQHIG